MFTDKDKQQISDLGQTTEGVLQQLGNHKKGFPFLKIKKAATVGDGILDLDEKQLDRFTNRYDKNSQGLKVVKFVPASGAASRMFKSLFAFMEQWDGSDEAYEAMKKDQGPQSMFYFFKHLDNFAFNKDLRLAMEKDGHNLAEAQLKREYSLILTYLLTDKGLGYGDLPKGLLMFHNYADGARTPVEEHLVEAARYAANSDGQAHIHLTVSPEHEDRFRAKVAEVKETYEKAFGATFQVSYSRQKPSTDTIAAGTENEPFREDDGSLLFRPGGHGALLENLNDLDADIVFIKNIDNVVPDKLKDPTVQYKKAIGGILLELKAKIDHYLEDLSEDLGNKTLAEAEQFLQEDLFTLPPENYETLRRKERQHYLVKKLNRPLRVCGMVKNEGEPGGGPFWAVDPDGSASLQIAESAQIDLSDPKQKKIMEGATHFNPVDIVCSLKDAKGQAYDLSKFTDPDTGFIAIKSKGGKELKALELPGLWNGAMSDWNTVFVEVPIVTFNPVKTVNDLLREEHQ